MLFHSSLLRKPPDDLRVKHASNHIRNGLIGFVAVVVILATVTVSAFRSKRLAPIGRISISTSPQTAAPFARENSPVKALSITLRRGGFVPREITRPAGDYFLSVSNISGASEILLRFESEQGGTVQVSRVSRERPSWRQNVRLSTGTYLLTEANHPRWICRITITGN